MLRELLPTFGRFRTSQTPGEIARIPDHPTTTGETHAQSVTIVRLDAPAPRGTEAVPTAPADAVSDINQRILEFLPFMSPR